MAANPLLLIRATDAWDKASIDEWLELEEGPSRYESIMKDLLLK